MSKKSKKKDKNKAKPSDLGKGAAKNAAKALKNRRNKINDATKEDFGEKPRKGMKGRR
ncbi:MAG: hypothetical protein OCD76_07305 [Reichenbachiella sp.]